MLETVLLIGVGVIVALGGAILLDRERFNRKPRTTYRLATVAGLALSVAGVIGVF